jgi:predicted dehydrogenase
MLPELLLPASSENADHMTSKTSTLIPRIAVIGAGAWGRNHVRTFAGIKDCCLAAVCDSRSAALDWVRTSYPMVQTQQDVARIFADPEIEAVVLAVPAPLHASLAREAILAGKHVLVEKPFTLTVSEAEDLLALPRRNGQVLMVGHLLLFHPVVVRLKQMIQSGELGEIRYVYCQRLNLGVVRRDENAWWSLAPHDISVLLHLFDEVPNRIVATGAGFLQTQVEDVVFASLQFPSGRIGQIHVSWLDPHKVRQLVVVGSKKMAVFDDMEPSEKLRIYDKCAMLNENPLDFAGWITLRFGDVLIPSIRMVEPLSEECRHFIHCIRSGELPVTSAETALPVIKVLEEASLQLANNRFNGNSF